MQKYRMYIDGAWVEPRGGRWFETTNPYTGEVWAQIAHGSAADVDNAVAAATRAFEGDWSQFTPSRREWLLCELADLIDEDAARLAEIEVRDNGKLYAEMSAQTSYLAEWYRYYAGLADKIVSVRGARSSRIEPGIVSVHLVLMDTMELGDATSSASLDLGGEAFDLR